MRWSTCRARTAIAATACRFRPDRPLHCRRRHDRWRTGYRPMRPDLPPPAQRPFQSAAAGTRARRQPPRQSMAASVAELWPAVTRGTSQDFINIRAAIREDKASARISAFSARCDALATECLSPERARQRLPCSRFARSRRRRVKEIRETRMIGWVAHRRSPRLRPRILKEDPGPTTRCKRGPSGLALRARIKAHRLGPRRSATRLSALDSRDFLPANRIACPTRRWLQQRPLAGGMKRRPRPL